MVFINLKVVAVSEADLRDFIRLCGVIQRLGEVGSSRTVTIHVDGDGSGRFSFYVNEERVVPPPDLDIENIPEIWLGE